MAAKSRCQELTVPQLKQMCKDNKVRGFSKMKKEELVINCCEAFSKELGASPSELTAGKEKEIRDKVETVKVLKDVLKKKMVLSRDWLDNFKKSTGHRFEFGDLDDRKVEFSHDPVFKESRSLYSSSRYPKYHKSRVTTDPLSVRGYEREKNGYLFYLSGDNLVGCWLDNEENVPCISETGRRHFITSDYKNERWAQTKTPSMRIGRRWVKIPPADISSSRTRERIKNDEVTCFHDPGKCAVEGKKMSILNDIIGTLENANNGMDALKDVIVTEKSRIAEAEKTLSKKRERAKTSLEGWKL